jgi:hypothetical protein
MTIGKSWGRCDNPTNENIPLKDGYTQVVIWPGVDLDGASGEEIEGFFMAMLDARVQYLENIYTAPDRDEDGNIDEETGGRSDIFVAVHKDDIMNMTIKRFNFGMRWIEDVLKYNDGNEHLYPTRVLEYCSW